MAQAARSLPPAGAAQPVPRLALVPPPRRPVPTRRIIWRRRLLALVALAAAVAAGAAWLELSRPSGAGGDTASIASLLRQSERDPASLCGHLSPAMLAASGGRAACVASSPRRGPAGIVHDIRVSGSSATAFVSRPSGNELVRLVRRDGAWVVAAVR